MDWQNDPELTAYALGEVDEAQRVRIEALLKDSEAARKWVEEIRETAGTLKSALAAEPSPHLADAQRKVIEEHVSRSVGAPRRRWRIPLALGAAASVAIVSGLYVLLEREARVSDLPTPAVAHLETPKEQPAMTQPRTLRDTPPQKGERPLASSGPMPLAIGREIESLGYVGTKDQATGSLAPEPSEFAVPGGVAGGVPGGTVGGIVGGVPDFRRVDPNVSGFRDADRYTRPRDFNTESYDRIEDNPFLRVSEDSLSTFSIDVDTASYANVRRFLTEGRLPPKDAVRIEEMVNYFTYDYPPPRGREPFSVNVEVADAPWSTSHRLVRIGLKGRADERRPAANLVFLIDVSGSMMPPNKLPLVKQAMKLLTRQLTEEDEVAIVVYAGASGLVLPPTSGDRKETILGALDRLEAGGSTNGGGGIELAYQVATRNFIEHGVNRVILATDGDFNVGVTNQGDLTRLIEEKAKTGVFLTVLGFGMGNLKDSTMEKLADRGNGNYAYIDSPSEARKVLVEQLGSTLVTIAKDVKIQIEFNPAEVGAYRLIGYENRILRHQDFNDDTKDAGEIGSGHTVTALYEVVPAGSEMELPAVDPLKYQKPAPRTKAASSDELLTLKLRYKEPEGSESKLLTYPVRDEGRRFRGATHDFKFAAAVAAFGMILRDSPHRGSATFDLVRELAEEGKGEDKESYRAEFLELVAKADYARAR